MVYIAQNSKRQTFNRIIIFVASLTIFFAYMDILGYHMWNSVGGWTGDVYATTQPLYMIQFWSFAVGMIIVASIIYYMFSRDKSEALAVFVAGIATVWGGVEDIVYYIFRGIPLDQSMPWLINTPVGTVARMMGLDTVTPLALILNVSLFCFIGFSLIKWLYKQKW